MGEASKPIPRYDSKISHETAQPILALYVTATLLLLVMFISRI